MPKRKKTGDKEFELVASYILTNEYLAVLTEEFGEIGRAIQGEGDLADELIQLASCCVRWLENIKNPG